MRERRRRGQREREEQGHDRPQATPRHAADEIGRTHVRNGDTVAARARHLIEGPLSPALGHAVGMRIVSTSGTEVCSHCIHARRPLQRLRGLLGRPPLAPGAGLLLEPCASVHTLFLRYAIEVVFLRADGTILRVVPVLRPWRHAAYSGARSVLELPPGTCARGGVRVGDRLLTAGATSPMVQYEISGHPLPSSRGGPKE